MAKPTTRTTLQLLGVDINVEHVPDAEHAVRALIDHVATGTPDRDTITTEWAALGRDRPAAVRRMREAGALWLATAQMAGTDISDVLPRLMDAVLTPGASAIDETTDTHVGMTDDERATAQLASIIDATLTLAATAGPLTDEPWSTLNDHRDTMTLPEQLRHDTYQARVTKLVDTASSNYGGGGKSQLNGPLAQHVVDVCSEHLGATLSTSDISEHGGAGVSSGAIANIWADIVARDRGYADRHEMTDAIDPESILDYARAAHAAGVDGWTTDTVGSRPAVDVSVLVATLTADGSKALTVRAAIESDDS